MHRRAFVATGGAALALLSCAPTPRRNPLPREVARNLTIREIAVTTSGTSFESELARDYTSDLGPDLRAALELEFQKRLAAEGVRLEAEPSRFNLANSLRTATGGDRSRLLGTVRLIDEGQVLASYPIQVSAGQASETRTSVLIDATFRSSAGYYREMVRTFADTARTMIEE